MAVCGRRDAVMPRNVQKDPEASHTWLLKDDVVRRGKVYYAKLARGQDDVPGAADDPRTSTRSAACAKPSEPGRLSRDARAILRCCGREWEMATADLRDDSGVTERRRLHQGDGRAAGRDAGRAERGRSTAEVHLHLDARRRALSRCAARRVTPETARREMARAFLASAGMTVPGELARVTGLSRAEAGLGNRALVAEGVAVSPARGVYRLADLPAPDAP